MDSRSDERELAATDQSTRLHLTVVLPNEQLQIIQSAYQRAQEIEEQRQIDHERIDTLHQHADAYHDRLSGEQLKILHDQLTAPGLAGTGAWKQCYESLGLTKESAMGRIRMTEGYDTNASKKSKQLGLVNRNTNPTRLLSEADLEAQLKAAADEAARAAVKEMEGTLAAEQKARQEAEQAKQRAEQALKEAAKQQQKRIQQAVDDASELLYGVQCLDFQEQHVNPYALYEVRTFWLSHHLFIWPTTQEQVAQYMRQLAS